MQQPFAIQGRSGNARVQDPTPVRRAELRWHGPHGQNAKPLATNRCASVVATASPLFVDDGGGGVACKTASNW